MKQLIVLVTNGFKVGCAAERNYLLAVFVMALVFVFRFTPVGGIDEQFHFERAQQISQGNFFAQRYGRNDFGGGLDNRMIEWMRYFTTQRDHQQPADREQANALAVKLDSAPSARTRLSFPSTASFSPLMYLPSAIAMDAARLVHARVDTQFYAGRIGNLVGAFILLIILLSILPVGRLAMLVLMTTPTCLHLATAYSADPVTNLTAFIFIACCLRARMATDPQERTTWMHAVLWLAAPLGFLKLTCCLISLACLMIPADAFASARQRVKFCATAIGLSVGAALLWNMLYPFNPGAYWGTGANPKLALHNLLIHPLAVAEEFKNTYSVGSQWWWEDAWGRFGGGPEPLFFKIGQTTSVISAALMGCLLLVDVRQARSAFSGTMLIVLGAVYSFLILLAFYVSFAKIGEWSISGLQGRYFLLTWGMGLLGAALLLPKRERLWNQAAILLLCVNFVCVARTGILSLAIYARIWN
nr:DUF2142 domain-containing protein [uncultured Acetobacter sp.]